MASPKYLDFPCSELIEHGWQIWLDCACGHHSLMKASTFKRGRIHRFIVLSPNRGAQNAARSAMCKLEIGAPVTRRPILVGSDIARRDHAAGMGVETHDDTTAVPGR